MAQDHLESNVWKGRRIKVLAANPSGMELRLREAISRQAYRLFESHGERPGHEAQDWEQAKSEVVRPLECGLVTQTGKVSICTDITVFGEGDVEVCVEPRRLNLCGRPRRPESCGTSPQPDLSCRALDLPVEVEPSHVQARLNGRILEIDLYRTPLSSRAA